jgi:hypothetical protein
VDETKLPKWARDQMQALRREVERLREDRDALLGKGDPEYCQGFWFEGYFGNETAFPAPLQTRRLIFRGSTGKIQITAERSYSKGETWLNISSLDGDGLIVRPHVTNVVNVRVGGLYEVG